MVPTSARYGSAPATLEVAVADAGPYFWLSGRSTTMYPPKASVASRTSAAPTTARVPLAGDNAAGPAITATPARATVRAGPRNEAGPLAEEDEADDQDPDGFGGQQQGGRGRGEPLQPDRHRQVVPDHAEQASGD